MKSRTWSIVVSCIAVAGVSVSFAEDREKPEVRSIRVSETGTAAASPDQAQIDIGVLNQAPTAAQVASENAKRVDAVLTAVRKLLDPKSELKTIGYVVNPVYGEYKPNHPPTITGYSAENTVRVKTGDLGGVSKIIDTAMEAGANNVRDLQFSIKDEQALKGQALREAVTKAKADAEVIASALGVKILRVVSVESGGAERPIARPLAMGVAAAARAGGPPTPVEPGTLEVSAGVTLTVEIAP